MKDKGVRIIVFIGFTLMLLYIFLFSPVYDYGDASAYLKYAETMAGNGNTDGFMHRSPFYSWIISPVIKPLGVEKTARLITVLQYILVFLSGLLLYSAISRYFTKNRYALYTTILFYLNFSVIFYGYMVLTETTTMFLLILTVWSLTKGLHDSSGLYLFLSGISAAVTVLCRFNTLPIILVLITIIFLIESLRGEIKLVKGIKKCLVFLLPVLIILNGYAFYNYNTKEFYGLFPMGGSSTVSRNALINTITGDEPVSDKQKPVLAIFKEARGKYEPGRMGDRKGSLKLPGRENILEKLYGGFLVFSLALPELCKYYGIDPQKPEPDLSIALKPFYSEIRQINRNKVWQLRLYSLLSSFRSSTGLVISETPARNLGKLPAWLIAGYKGSVFLFSAFVFLASITYIILLIMKRLQPNEIVLTSVILYAGFLFINFFLATVADANRYKFPVVPFIIFLGVYFISELYFRIKPGEIRNRLNKKHIGSMQI